MVEGTGGVNRDPRTCDHDWHEQPNGLIVCDKCFLSKREWEPKVARIQLEDERMRDLIDGQWEVWS